MQALIDLRRRIRSVRNTQQITQAMKTVSTAKFKKAQRGVLEARPYWHNLPGLLERISAWAAERVSPLLERREEKKIEVVVLTSDKGLCGAFNSNLLAKANEFVQQKAARSEVGLVLLGKKAVNFFKRQGHPIHLAYAEKMDKFTLGGLKEIARFLMRQYVFSRTDAVTIIYNEFKSILAPRIMIARVLPLPAPDRVGMADALPPDWEPEEERLLGALLPLYIETQVYHCYFESQAAEQAARMMAMENATKNAEDLISDLTMALNKIRQASITKELLEIMTAVEALA